MHYSAWLNPKQVVIWTVLRRILPYREIHVRCFAKRMKYLATLLLKLYLEYEQ